MRRIGYQVIDWLVDREGELGPGPVADLHGLDELLSEVDEPLPETPLPAADSLDFLRRKVIPQMTRVNHPGFHAYIPAPGSFYGAVGAFIGASLNPFLGSSLGGATFAALELVTLRWIAEAVGYSGDAAGIFTSGGSMANLGALAAARATTDDRQSAVIFVSDQGHASMEKAASVLGFSPGQIERLPTADDFRLIPDVVQERIRSVRADGRMPLFVSANAGTTNTGAIDPLPDLADICAAEDVWFHVDGAYGGFAAITDRGRARLAGMDRADSLTLDPHKWLYAPMGSGCLLVNRPGALERAFAAHGDYLKDVSAEEVNFFDRGPELSRRARALPVWMLMRTVGLAALRREIDADLDLAALAEDLIAAEPRFEFIDRGLSIITFRLRPASGESEDQRAEREQELVRRLLRGEDALVSGTTLQGRSALRFVVLNHRTDEARVRQSIETVAAAARAGLP